MVDINTRRVRSNHAMAGNDMDAAFPEPCPTGQCAPNTLDIFLFRVSALNGLTM